MKDRVTEFHGIHNFRDYGGYAARDGARLRSGVLYRSGQHVDATDADLERLATIPIATIIDLRGNSERAQYPCARPAGFAAEVLFSDGETATQHNAPHVEAAREVKTAAEAHAAMVNLYGQMPFRPMLIATFRLYFSALADRDGGSLLHCLAGKDRTGVGAGILHALMGVHADDIMADYLLTNIAGNIERRIAAGAATVRSNFGPEMSDDAIRTLMSVDAAYLDRAFDAICASHGSVRDYAREILLVDDAMLSRIEARLLE